MSFLPARQNFKVWIGSTWHYRFQWLIEADNVTTPQNLTGFKGTMTIKSTNGVTTYQTLTSENGGIVFNGTSGLIDLILTSTQTKELGWKAANYILMVVDPATSEDLPLLVGRLSAVGPL